METALNIARRSRTVARRRMALRDCAHCGGDVRQVKDIYGTYWQCLQCSREIQIPDPAMPHMGTTEAPRERLVA